MRQIYIKTIKFIIKVIGVYLFLGGIGFAADLISLTNIDLLDFISNNSPWSYITIILSLVIIFLIRIVSEQSKLVLYPKTNQPEKIISDGDLNILNQFSQTFSGNTMHVFFSYLQEDCLLSDQVNDFEYGINRFLQPDKKFSNNTLEILKTDFLTSLDRFLNFSGNTFNTINQKMAKFYGGISEFDILTMHRESYNKDSIENKELKKNLYEKWSNIINTIRSMLPDYIWND